MAGRDITVYDEAKLGRDEVRVNKGFWRKLRRVLGRIPFADDLLAAYYCASDSETPLYVKAVLMGALAYFVIPTDLLPDFFSGIGFTDDAAVLLTALQSVQSNLKPAHREAARRQLARLAGEVGRAA